MKKILFLLLIFTSCRAQKADTLQFVTVEKTIEITDKNTATDIEVVLLSPYELQQKVLLLEDLAIKNGWIVQSKFGVLNAKDVSQFQTFTEAQLGKTYTLDILKRFAESLKISILGTKATLVKNIKFEVLKRTG